MATKPNIRQIDEALQALQVDGGPEINPRVLDFDAVFELNDQGSGVYSVSLTGGGSTITWEQDSAVVGVGGTGNFLENFTLTDQGAGEITIELSSDINYGDVHTASLSGRQYLQANWDGSNTSIALQNDGVDIVLADETGVDVTGNLGVTGDLDVTGALTVGNGADLTGNLDVTGDITISNGSDLNFEGDNDRIGVLAGNTLSFLNVDFPEVSNQRGIVRFFRATDTTAGGDFDIHMADGTSGTAFSVSTNSSTLLKYNGDTKLSTIASGVDVTGDVNSTGRFISIDASDFRPFTATRGGTNPLYTQLRNGEGGVNYGILGDGTMAVVQTTAGSGAFEETWIEGARNGAVSINYNGSTKLETTSSGIDVTGNVAATGGFTLVGANEALNTRAGNATSFINFDFPELTTEGGFVRTFRETNTTDNCAFIIYRGDGTGSQAFRVDTNGTTSLYSDGDVKLETTSSGVDVTGQFEVTGDVIAGDDLILDTNNLSALFGRLSGGSLSQIARIDSGDALELGNSNTSANQYFSAGNHDFFEGGTRAAQIGNSVCTFDAPIQAYGDALYIADFQSARSTNTRMRLTNNEGGLVLYTDAGSVIFYTTDGIAGGPDEIFLRGFAGGSTTLSYAGAKKIETTSSGIGVTGGIETSGTITVVGQEYGVDNDRTSSSSAHGFRSRNSEGGYYLRGDTGGLRLYQTNSAGSLEDIWIACADNAGVGLRYNGSEKLVTTSTGVSVTGNLTASGDVTGNSSDLRTKDVIRDLSPEECYNAVKGKRVIQYTNNGINPDVDTDQVQVGLVANEWQEDFPEFTPLAPFDRDEDGNSKSGEDYLTLKYERTTAILLGAIQKLQEEVEALKNGTT